MNRWSARMNRNYYSWKMNCSNDRTCCCFLNGNLNCFSKDSKDSKDSKNDKRTNWTNCEKRCVGASNYYVRMYCCRLIFVLCCLSHFYCRLMCRPCRMIRCCYDV